VANFGTATPRITETIVAHETIDAAKNETPSFILGDYEVYEVIGRGGMAVVHRARQKSLNRFVALKIIKAGGDAARFRNEAEAVAALDHPHIVPVYEVGEEAGRLYLSMKLMEGSLDFGFLNCDFRSKDRRASGRKPDVERIKGLTERVTVGLTPRRSPIEIQKSKIKNDCSPLVALVSTVARAVHHAHQRGILHRDLKPSNILLDRDGQPHVTDFGLAKRLDIDLAMTHSGMLVGTPHFMAPEQASGLRGAASTATDVYGLGAVLYTLLAGRPPFVGETPLDVLDQLRTAAPGPLMHKGRPVDRDLATITLKCLEKEPARRYASAESLALDLERWLAGEPIAARPIGRSARAWRWCRRHRLMASMSAVIVTSLVAGMVGLGVSNHLLTVKQGETDAALALAKKKERTAKLHAYVANMRLAGQALTSSSEQELRQLLEQSIPGEGEEDFRGFEWDYLWCRCQERHQELPSLMGHEGDVYHIAYAPDGKTLASAGKDGTVRIWDLASATLRTTLRHSDYEVNCVAFSPDGKVIASADDHGSVNVWTGPYYSGGHELVRHQCPIVALAFSPDCKMLAVGNGNGAVHYYHSNYPWDELFHFFSFRSRVETLAFSPDGKQLAVGGTNVELFDILSQTFHKVIGERGAGSSSEVAFSHSGLLIAANEGPRVVLIDRASGLTKATLKGHTGKVNSIAFSPDDQLLASGSDDGAVRLWDVPSGKLRAILDIHSQNLPRVWCVAFSPDGRTLAASYRDGTIHRWALDWLADHRSLGWPGDLWGSCPVFSPQDGRMAVAGGDGKARFFSADMKTADELKFGREADRGLTPAWLVFSPDRRTLLAVIHGGTVEITALDRKTNPFPIVILKNPTGNAELCQVAFKPNGYRFLTWSDRHDGVHEWGTSTGESYGTIAPDSKFERCMLIPDGRHIVYLLSEEHDPNQNRFRVLDLDTKESRTSDNVGLIGEYGAMAYAPSTGMLATVTGMRSVRFWDLQTLEPRGIVHLTGAPINNLAFSPDGKTLASSAEDGIKLWNVELCQELLTLEATEKVYWLAFTPDGRTLISHHGKEVRLWQGDLAGDPPGD
jgi:eukaryotic-like serine/threonine-protein kinase